MSTSYRVLLQLLTKASFPSLPEDVVFLNPCQAPEVLVEQERPTLFSDIWSVSAAILQWLLEFPPWNLQELCARYKFRENHKFYALQVSDPFLTLKVA